MLSVGGTIPFDPSRQGCVPIAWMKKTKPDRGWLGQGQADRKDKIGSSNLATALATGKLQA